MGIFRSFVSHVKELKHSASLELHLQRYWISPISFISSLLNIGFLKPLPRPQGRISSMLDFYNFYLGFKVKSARWWIFTTFSEAPRSNQLDVGFLQLLLSSNVKFSLRWAPSQFLGSGGGQHDIDYCRLPPEAQPKSNFSAKTVFTFVTPNSKRNALQANNLNMPIFTITYATAKPKLAAKSHKYLDYCWEMQHLQYVCDYP